MLTIILGLFVIFIAFGIVQTHYEVLRPWHHTFDQFQFSPQEFYEALQSGIKKRELPHLSYSRVTYQETFIFGQSRTYLRIERGVYVFDVCAAPFGSGFYVSWWFQEKTTFFRRMLLMVPVVKWFLDIKTFREIDTETVFRELVHASVLEAIDAMTNEKGIRLTEAERAIPPSKHFTA